MASPILSINTTDWQLPNAPSDWIHALEAGKVLFFPRLAFTLQPYEHALLRADLLQENVRNISLDHLGNLKGVQGDSSIQSAVHKMIERFRKQATQLIASLAPVYIPSLRTAPTSYRPAKVETRPQSWRADDRRLHVDAFPSRPNQGERILRVFTNIHPEEMPRIWRIGEPFEKVAQHFLPRLPAYSRWWAKLLSSLHVTKSLRSEYDHLMLQLHDAMKADLDYQKQAEQITMSFPPGSVWICFSDQTSHAVMSGQYMMEQTFHLPANQQYEPGTSPLAILTRLTGHTLI